jgi:ribosomal protein S18 acetylase RimI-like enzyme
MKNLTINEKLNELNETYSGVYIFRYLEEEDYYKDYFNLLSQLTLAEKPDVDSWSKRFNEINNSKFSKIFIVESIEDKKVIGSITCSIELKFIRNLGSICHIEDFVIDEKHRNNKIGTKLLSLANIYAKQIGCYKVLLDSKDEVMGFYEKNGFKRTSNGMTIYL